jgi:hypothetical protein
VVLSRRAAYDEGFPRAWVTSDRRKLLDGIGALLSN